MSDPSPVPARETAAARAARAGEIFDILRQTYPNAHCELAHRSPLELLVATILSAQCSDQQVNRVTPALFERHPTAADYSKASPETLMGLIRRLGLFRNKARSIQACCQKLVERHNGQVPHSMEALLELDGVGRKTANVVLGNAFGINAGVVVDTHVARLSKRLGLSKHASPVRIEQDLMKLAPASDWTLVSHWLIWHGRRRCPARSPDCARCELRALCPRKGLPRGV